MPPVILNSDIQDVMRGVATKNKSDKGPVPAHFLTRREFLQWMGAVTTLLSSEACLRPPREKILPYNKQPEEIVPDKPLFFATSYAFRGRGIGLLVESHMGRPTKIEGNPSHPASLGATDAITQALTMELYDPDRSKEVKRANVLDSWGGFVADFQKQLALADPKKGSNFRILFGATSSPTVLDQLRRLAQRFPQAKLICYEPVGFDNAREGARVAFGKRVQPLWNFKASRVVASFDHNFFS